MHKCQTQSFIELVPSVLPLLKKHVRLGHTWIIDCSICFINTKLKKNIWMDINKTKINNIQMHKANTSANLSASYKYRLLTKPGDTERQTGQNDRQTWWFQCIGAYDDDQQKGYLNPSKTTCSTTEGSHWAGEQFAEQTQAKWDNHESKWIDMLWNDFIREEISFKEGDGWKYTATDMWSCVCVRSELLHISQVIFGQNKCILQTISFLFVTFEEATCDGKSWFWCQLDTVKAQDTKMPLLIIVSL